MVTEMNWIGKKDPIPANVAQDLSVYLDFQSAHGFPEIHHDFLSPPFILSLQGNFIKQKIPLTVVFVKKIYYPLFYTIV